MYYEARLVTLAQALLGATTTAGHLDHFRIGVVKAAYETALLRLGDAVSHGPTVAVVRMVQTGLPVAEAVMQVLSSRPGLRWPTVQDPL